MPGLRRSRVHSRDFDRRKTEISYFWPGHPGLRYFASCRDPSGYGMVDVIAASPAKSSKHLTGIIPGCSRFTLTRR